MVYVFEMSKYYKQELSLFKTESEREMFDALKSYQMINSEGLSFSPTLLMKKFQPVEAC